MREQRSVKSGFMAMAMVVSLVASALTVVPPRLTAAFAAELPVASASAASVLDVWAEGADDPRELTVLGDRLYFTAVDDTGRQIWRTDGSVGGAEKVTDLPPPANANLAPRGLEVADGKLVFRADYDLWVYDPRVDPARLDRVTDLKNQSTFPYTNATSLSDPTVVGGDVYVFNGVNDPFYAWADLWYSTGDLESAADIATQVSNFNFVYRLPTVTGSLGNRLLFDHVNLNLAGTAYMPWASDGTVSGTVCQGTGTLYTNNSRPRSPGPFLQVGDRAYFTAQNLSIGTTYRELWATGGCATSTSAVYRFGATAVTQPPGDPVALDDTRFVLAADDGVHGLELWVSGGTAETTSLTELREDAGSDPQHLTPVDGGVFLTADDGTNGREVWFLSAATDGVDLVAELTPGDAGTPVVQIAAAGSGAFVFVDDGSGRSELWATDGTQAGSRQVASFTPGALTLPFRVNEAARRPVLFDGSLWFVADEGDGGTLWRTVDAAPEWPQDAALRLVAAGAGFLQVEWDAALLDGDLAGYDVLVDGEPALDGVASTSALLSGLAPETAYEVSVVARATTGAESIPLAAFFSTTAADDEGALLPLQASAQPGAVALSWPTVPGATALAVYRAAGSADATAVSASLAGTATGFLDTQVAASTTYVYEVRATIDGTERTVTDVAEVTTTAIGIGSVTAAPTQLARGAGSTMAALGADLRITVSGDPYRVATARVRTRDGVGTEQTSVVDLVDADQIGTHRGAMEIATGMAEILDVEATLCDIADRCATLVGSVSLPVGGELQVTVDDTTGAFDGGRIMVSDGAGAGQRVAIEGGVAAVDRLRPSDAYMVQLLDRDGVVQERRSVVVRAGEREPLEISPRVRQRVEITVVGSDGAPSVGAAVTLTDPLNGDRLAGTTDANGRYVAQAVPVGPAEVAVRTANSPVVEVVSDPTIEVTYPSTPVEVRLVGAEFATVRGRVVQSDPGKLSPFAQVSASFSHPGGGGSVSRTVTADANGDFEIAVLPGGVAFTASYLGQQASETREVPLDGVELDLDLGVNVDRREVNLRLFAQYAGEEPVELQIEWRLALHLRLKMDGTLVRQPTTTVNYTGEDVHQLCARGDEAGLEPACATVVFDENDIGWVDLVLAQPQAVNARFVDAGGEPVFGFADALLTALDGDRRTVVSSTRQYGDSMSVLVPAPGDFEVEFTTSRGVAGPVPFSVALGEAVDLGALVVGASGPLSRASTLTSSRTHVLPGDVVTLRAAVKNGGNVPVEDLTVRIPRDAGAVLLPEGLLINGSPAAPAIVSGSLEDGSAAITLGSLPAGATTVVHYAMRVTAGTPIGTRLQAGLVLDYATGEARQERLVTTPIIVAGLSISAPRIVQQREVVLRGLAPAGARVRISDGDAVIGQAEAGPGGTWSLVATLVDRGPLFSHQLTVAAPDEPGFGTDTTQVRFDTSLPVAESVQISHGGRELSVDPRLGTATFPFTYAESRPFSVRVEFDRPDDVTDVTLRIGSVSIALARDGDGYRGSAYVAAGQVGPIWLDYAATVRTVDLEATLADLQRPGILQQRLPTAIADLQIDEVVQASDPVTAAGSGDGASDVRLVSADQPVTLAEVDQLNPTEADDEVLIRSSAPGAGLDFETTIRVQAVDFEPSATEIARAAKLGVPVYQFAMNGSFSPGQFTGTFSGLIPFEAVEAASVAAAAAPTSDDVATFLLQTVAASPATLRLAAVGQYIRVTGEVIAKGGDLNDIDGLLNSRGRYEELEELLDQVRDQCGADAHEGYQDELDDMAVRVLASQLLTAGLAVTAFVGGVLLTPIGGTIISLVGMSVSIAADHLLASDIDDIRRRLNADPDCEEERQPGQAGSAGVDPVANPRWIYDPAGFVFEAVESNVLTGASATLFEGLPASVETSAEITTWQPWDATWYEQQNPLTTGPDGTYAWDVPLGWWQVVASLDGYESTTSEPLQVLPLHLDVHLGLVSTSDPAIDEVVAYAASGEDDGVVEVVFDHWMRAALTESTIRVLDAGGAPLAGTVTAVEPEPHFLGRADTSHDGRVAPPGELLATTFAFVPDVPLLLEQSVTVTVDGLAQAYHLRILGDDVALTAEVVERPTDGGDPGDNGDGGSGGGGGSPGVPTGPNENEPESKPQLPVRFSDIGPGATHWEAIAALVGEGVVRGYPDGTYRPASSLTRGQAASVLQAALELPDGPTDAFPDAGSTHAAAIGALHAAGILGGYPDGTFRPREPVTRGQMGKLLGAAAGITPQSGAPSRFSDVAGTTHAAAIDAIAAAALINGFPDGTFRPREPMTRAQAATVVWNLMSYLDNNPREF